jgi:hypothetical protein
LTNYSFCGNAGARGEFWIKFLTADEGGLTRINADKMEFGFLNWWIKLRYCLFAAGISGEV